MELTVVGIGIVVSALSIGGLVTVRTPAFAISGGLGGVIAVIGLLM